MSEDIRPESGPCFVLSSDGELHGEDTPENREIVRRIEACVNACDGISTEELESGIIEDMRNVIGGVIPFLKNKFEDQKQAPASPHFVEKSLSEEIKTVED